LTSLADLDPDLLIDLLHALISAGVPPTTVAIALSISPSITRDIASSIHIRDFGTDELSEAMHHLQWEAYKTSLDLLRRGTPADRIRTINMVLSRTVALAGKTDSGGLDKIRDDLTSVLSEVAETPPEREVSEFVIGSV
jgi:hypothetical protein